MYNKHMPQSITIIAAKIARQLTSLKGNGGTALPGLVAERLDPDILRKLAAGNFRDGITLVTGTNGKTTTALLAANILAADGRQVLHNHGGSNLMRGIIATIIEAADLRGRVAAQTAVFEVDENAFVQIAPVLQPTHIIVTNLFRDQLDRYGELDTTAQKIAAAIAKVEGVTVHLNADDPLVASLSDSHSKPVSYFGVGDYQETKLDDLWSADSLTSPVSGAPLEYSRRFYSHIGHYRSSNGDFARPKPQLEASQIRIGDNSLSFRTNHTKNASITVPIGGFYNVYNVLAAMSLAESLQISPQLIQASLATAQPAFGRTETVQYRGRQLRLLLAKNPVGLNQTIEQYLLADPTAPILFIINDNLADGRDVSWLWDADIEALRHHSGPIIVSGQRAYDMALRLKYANVVNYTTETRIDHALNLAAKKVKPKQTVNIVPTYTAMLAVRTLLVASGSLKEYWR